MKQLAQLAFIPALFLLVGCNASWTNWFKTESVTPEVLRAPETAKELVEIFREALANGKRVRMTGNGHSLSDIAINSDVLLTPQNLNHPLSIDCRRMRGSCDPSLVRIEAGIKIADLNTYLDHQGRALFNMGGYDGQTFAGIMMTATHGSGLSYGPMVDEVAGFQMVTGPGEMVQVEPTNGITDPARFPGVLEEDSSIRVRLIQDDDAFNAARVSIGSMGIIYSVTLRTDRKFWLKEVRHLISWSELKKPGGYLDRALHGLPIYGDGRPSPEHWELQYSPYLNEKGDHTFLITDRYHSYTPLPEQSSGSRGQFLSQFASGVIALLGTPIADVVDLFPELAKPLLSLALNSEVETSFTNVSYKVFNIGVINNTPVLGIESAFDMRDTAAFIERSFQLSDRLLAEGIPLTSPMAVRLVKKSDALIAMQNGRDTSFIEIISMRAGKNTKNLLATHQKTYLAEFGARPHWGLDLNTFSSEAEVRALYPETWDRWMTQYRRFNVAGTLDGKVTDRLGISVHPRTWAPETPSSDLVALPAVLNVTPLSPAEAARTFEERRATLPIFLNAIDRILANERWLSDSRLNALSQLEEQLLRRNGDVVRGE